MKRASEALKQSPWSGGPLPANYFGFCKDRVIS
jgi:hypothetical protein